MTITGAGWLLGFKNRTHSPSLENTAGRQTGKGSEAGGGSGEKCRQGMVLSSCGIAGLLPWG